MMRFAGITTLLIAAATTLFGQVAPWGTSLSLEGQPELRLREPVRAAAAQLPSYVFLDRADADALSACIPVVQRSGDRRVILPGGMTPSGAGPLLTAYRLARAPEGGRHVLLASGQNCQRALDLLEANPYEFQLVVLRNRKGKLRWKTGGLPPFSGVQFVSDESTRAAIEALDSSEGAALHPATDSPDGARASIREAMAKASQRLSDQKLQPLATLLGRFHRAASVGDEDLYFPIFTEDAVFLGTDASERWTKSAFEEFALPYFKRGSAWIFVPLKRNITLDPSGTLAFFDEVLGSRSYGTCRGSGVLRRVEKQWRVAQYNLTVPVPNALLSGVVADIRRHERGAKVTVPTTVILVRHAEKMSEKERDPELSARGQARAEALARLLKGQNVTALFATEYRRTQATLEPLAKALGTSVKVHPARDARGLVEKIRSRHAGGVVVIAGHSNTVPLLARLFGAESGIARNKTSYDDLLVLSLNNETTRAMSLSQGFAAPDPTAPPTSRPTSRPTEKSRK